MGVAKPKPAISIILALKVPSLRVKPFSRMNVFASFHFPRFMWSRKMQSMAWSFSSMALMAADLGFVRMLLIFSSSPFFILHQPFVSGF